MFPNLSQDSGARQLSFSRWSKENLCEPSGPVQP